MSRTPLLYALHSGNLYGTERMALATASGLSDRFEPVIFAPAGVALEEATRQGMRAIPFRGPADFALKLRGYLARHRKIAFFATGIVHSFSCLAWNQLYRRRIAHLHMVHGGTDELLSYGRKKKLNNRPVEFVAVSAFVRDRLIANGVVGEQIRVVENFLSPQAAASAPKRELFTAGGVRRVILVSRVDPIKRLDLLLDVLDRGSCPDGMTFRIFGTGWHLEQLRARAAARHPNVRFEGFRGDLGHEIAASDLLVHTCPVEPFGLAILEAMAAGVPVLVPDAGGAGDLVTECVTGFRFRANDASHLGERLQELAVASATTLNRVTEAARAALESRFSARRGIAEYSRLLEGML